MIDVTANRRARKYARSTQVARGLWALATPLFRLSPRPLWGWRRALLRLFGARVGKDVHIWPSARIAMPWNLAIGAQSAIGERVLVYNLGKIAIGRQVTISHQAHLCAGTHDHHHPDFPLQKLPISIGDGAWICADAFVGPNVTIGARAIVAARAVAVRDVAPDTIVAGNPAIMRGERRGDPA